MKIFFFSLIGVIFMCYFCINIKTTQESDAVTNVTNIDTVIDINDVFIIKNGVLDKHEYYLFYNKNNGQFIGKEHKPECKTCYDIFD